jgi:HAD superfamily hydrolase (TIGR01509 family)
MTERLRAVLFDFDHTLTDFGTHVRWEAARPAVQGVYREADVPEAFLQAHPGSITLYTAAAALAPLPEPEHSEAQRRASAVLAEFEAEGIPVTTLLPGVRELLEAITRLGLRTGIVTSNAAAVVIAILQRFGLDGAFEVLIGRDDVSRLKPDPEGLLAACRTLDVPPTAAAYIGDSVADIEAAAAAGMRTWGVATGLGSPEALRAAGAEPVFATLEEVPGHLESHLATAARQR